MMTIVSANLLTGAGLDDAQLPDYLAALYLNVPLEDRPTILEAVRQRLGRAGQAQFAIKLVPLVPTVALTFLPGCDAADVALLLQALALELRSFQPSHIAGMLDTARRLAGPADRIRVLVTFAVGLRRLARSADSRGILNPTIADAWRHAVAALAQVPADQQRELIIVLLPAGRTHFATLLAAARALSAADGRAEALCALAQAVPDDAGITGLAIMQEAYETFRFAAEGSASVERSEVC